MRTATALSLLALLLPCPDPAVGTPEVIYDSGNTAPISPYMSAVTVQKPAAVGGRVPGTVPLPPSRPESVIRFPIRTPEMQPGPLGRVDLPAVVRERLPALSVPLFLIGADDFSLRWLRRFRSRLVELNAIGMLIEVDSPEALAKMQKAASGITLVPASASELSKVLNVTAYPVLISKEGVEQ